MKAVAFFWRKDGFLTQRHIKFSTEHLHEFIANPLVNGSYVTELGYYPRVDSHYLVREHGADEHILFYCLEGKGTIQLDNGQTIQMGQNDLFCIPKKMAHRYFNDKENPWTIIWIHFNSPIATYLPIYSLNKMNVWDYRKKRNIENLFVEFFTIDAQRITLSTSIFMASLLNHLLTTIYLYEETSMYSKHTYILSDCIQYMNDHVSSDITLQDLSNKYNISVSYLNFIFKSETSKSPIEFFIDLKMNEACNLLKMTKMNISEISNELGYKDQFYFSRLFKKHMGASPRQYRTRV